MHSIIILAHKHSVNETNHDNQVTQLYLDVLHEIGLLGIIAPDGQHFFITLKGKQFLQDQNFDVHDPDRYAQNLPPIDDVSLAYAKEAIHCFNYNLFKASIIMIGGASESLLIHLARVIANKFTDKKLDGYLKSKATHINQVITRIDKICADQKILGYDSTYKPAVVSLANYIRLFRNEYGHPTKANADFEESYALLVCFKLYSKLIIELEKKIWTRRVSGPSPLLQGNIYV